MPSRPDRLDRRSRRLRCRDYARPGSYFVTICTQDKVCRFGRVVNKRMRLNAAGRLVRDAWHEIGTRFPGVKPGLFVVMPNHVHGILDLSGGSTASVGAVLHWFKTITTNGYIRGVKRHGWPRFDGRLWQRNYFDRILRDEDEYLRAEQYIRMNPARWWYDSLNPRGRV